MAGGTGWISGWESFDARVWNSESGGQHSDPDVQRQFWAGFDATDVKPSAIVNREEVRKSMTVQSVRGAEVCEGLYSPWILLLVGRAAAALVGWAVNVLQSCSSRGAADRPVI